MITKIPEGQVCEAFDARMIMPLSVLDGDNATENLNVSCLAPAFVYIEGTHGKKFLCDYHYHYEVYMTNSGYSDPNENIQKYIIDERERVKETFAKNVITTETIGKKCSLVNNFNPGAGSGCISDAFVKVTPIKLVVGKLNFTHIKDRNNISESIFYCNFHFRKIYYRYYSNGIIYEDFHKILDERSRIKFTIAEESLKVKYV
jgi:hypothetical protein